jgi:hypothetical protein
VPFIPEQVFTIPGCQVARATRHCVVATNIFGSAVWILFHVTLLAHRILRWLLDFWKIYAPLLHRVFKAQQEDLVLGRFVV